MGPSSWFHPLFSGTLFVAAVVVGFVYLIWRLRGRKLENPHRPPRWGLLFLYAYLAGVGHILLDFTNNYGVRPFWPFSREMVLVGHRFYCRARAPRFPDCRLGVSRIFSPDRSGHGRAQQRPARQDWRNTCAARRGGSVGHSRLRTSPGGERTQSLCLRESRSDPCVRLSRIGGILFIGTESSKPGISMR